MIRGNHESRSLTSVYGFMDECKTHHNLDLYALAMKAFDHLPIGILLNKEILCVHGGIPRNINSRSELFGLEKTDGEPSPGPVTDILWSDPSNNETMHGQCVRGAGCIFGHADVSQFIQKLGLKLVCRSHEECQQGFDFPFEDQCVVTIFSSANYCGSHNNAGILKFVDSNLASASIEFFKPFNKSIYTLPKTMLFSELRDQLVNEESDGSSPEVEELLA